MFRITAVEGENPVSLFMIIFALWNDFKIPRNFLRFLFWAFFVWLGFFAHFIYSNETCFLELLVSLGYSFGYCVLWKRQQRGLKYWRGTIASKSLHLKGAKKQSRTSEMNKYHIIAFWTGFYFSDTSGCQAAVVHRSSNLRSLPWSPRPEFLRRRWKKKCRVRLLPFSLKKTCLDFYMPSMESRTVVGFWIGSWEEPAVLCVVVLVHAGGRLSSCRSAAGSRVERGQPSRSRPCCRRGSVEGSSGLRC